MRRSWGQKTVVIPLKNVTGASGRVAGVRARAPPGRPHHPSSVTGGTNVLNGAVYSLQYDVLGDSRLSA